MYSCNQVFHLYVYGTSFDGTVNMLLVIVNWSKKRLTLQKFVVSDNSLFFLSIMSSV